MIEPGVYTDMSNDEYHSDADSISRSGIMEFRKSAYHYWCAYLDPERQPRKSTPEMIFGSAFHTMILEPHLFDKQFAPKPKAVLLKDVGREAYEEYKSYVKELEDTNRHILSDAEYLALMGMRDALHANTDALSLLEGAICESSYFWKDPHTELLLKARPDILQGNIIVDLKTCADASPRAFQRAMVDSGYHVQGAMMIDALREVEGRKIEKFILLAIEKKPPYATAIYMLDDIAIEHGRHVYKNTLLDLKNAIGNNEWPCYGVQTLSLPAWAMS